MNSIMLDIAMTMLNREIASTAVAYTPEQRILSNNE